MTFHRDYLLKGVDDYKIYKFIIRDEIYKPTFAKAHESLNLVGENGVFFVHGQFSPLQQLISGVLGPEGIVFGLLDHKNEFEEMIEIRDERNLEKAQLIIDSPFTVIEAESTWGIGMISPRIYQDYYIPYALRYHRILHDGGKICIDHLSGQPMKGFLDLIEQTDIDGLYGINFPPPDGELPLRDLLERWEGRMVAMTGLSPHFLATASENQVAEMAKRLLDEIGDRTCMMGTADDVVPGTPIRNLEAVSRAVESF